MPRTRSQERLEEEPEIVTTSEPAVIGGVPPWIAALLVAVGLIIAAVVLSLIIGQDLQIGPEPEFTIGVPETTAPTAATAPAPTAPPAPAPAGTLIAGEDSILPIPPGGLAPYVGRTVRGEGVAVYSVVADEGFWVGTSDVDRIYVIYQTGGFESPPDVDAGQRVSFVGALHPSTGELAPQFRLTEAEGLGLLQSQGYYISTANVNIVQA
jgi:hypothetical protein